MNSTRVQFENFFCKICECNRLQNVIVFSSRRLMQGCFFCLIVIWSDCGLSPSNLTVALPLPAGRGRRLGGGHLDLDREERLHQPAVLQDVRRLHLHTGPGRCCRHGNGRAGLLRHLQGAQEAAASGERWRHTRSMSSGGVRVSQSTEELTNFCKKKTTTLK